MAVSHHKQYQLRLTKPAADYLDRQSAKHEWAAPHTATVSLLLLQRIQKAVSAFQVSREIGSGEKMCAFCLPSGEMELLEGNEAEALVFWMIEEIQKGMVGAFCPEDPEEPGASYIEELGEYPDSAIGVAMASIDGLSISKETSK